MKLTLVLFALLLSPCLFAQNNRSSDSEGKLIALERMWNQAQLMHDSGALQSLIGERFLSTEWDGQLSSRDQFLADIRDPKFKPSVMSVQDLKVEFYGDTAIVVGIYPPRVSTTESPTSTPADLPIPGFTRMLPGSASPVTPA